MISFEESAYIGCLLFDDEIFYQQITKFLRVALIVQLLKLEA